MRSIIRISTVLLAGSISTAAFAASTAGTGLSITNNSSGTAYIDWTYTSNTTDEATACSQTTTDPNIQVFTQQKSKTQFACHVIYKLNTDSSVKQSVALPHLSGTGSSSFNMCSKTILTNKYDVNTKKQIPACDATPTSTAALCMTPNQYGPQGKTPLVKIGTNNVQPFESYHGGKYPYANLNIQNLQLLNSHYGITLMPKSQTDSTTICAMNLDLNQYRYDIQPLNISSRQVTGGKLYKKSSPILNMRTLFPNHATTNLAAPYDNQFYLSIDNGNHEIVPDNGSTPTTGNPLNLEFGNTGGNNAYKYNLFTSAALPTTSNLCIGGTCQVNICSCSKTVTENASKLFPGQGGVCPAGGMKSCIQPEYTNRNGATCTEFAMIDGQPACSSWIEKDNGPVGSIFRFSIYNGVFAKSPTEIYQDNLASKTKKEAPLTRLTAPLTIKGGKQTVNLSDYFAISCPISASKNLLNTADSSCPVPSSATYSVVGAKDIIPGRNSGDANTAAAGSPAANGGSGWGPAILNNGSAATPITSTSFLSIKGDALTVDPSALPNTTLKGYIVQLTIKASYNGNNAYQTIYLNISDENVAGSNGQLNPIFTLLKPGISAWVYGANMAPSVQDHANNPFPSVASTGDACKPGAVDYPNCSFLDAINNGGITKITPDIGWVQFGGAETTLTYWDPEVAESDGGIYNNMYSGSADPNGVGNTILNNWVNSPISYAAQYYQKFAPGVDFIETMEFDAPLKGYMPNLQVHPAIPSEISQMTHFVNDITYGVMKQSDLIKGIQFDVEPLPTDPKSVIFFKRIADRLARQGQINEIFAFANAMTPDVIMAQGPLGIFLPSTYDVGQVVDPYYYKDGKYTPEFGAYPAGAAPGKIDTSACTTYPQSVMYPFDGSSASTCPIAKVDYACHAGIESDANGFKYESPFVIKSWCNINLNNTLMTNASRFGMKDNLNPGNTNVDFAANYRTYGGHFQLAVPSEGSATNWTYNLITTPRLSNKSGGSCDASNPLNPCLIAGVPSTFTPIYIPYTVSKDGGLPTMAELQTAANDAKKPEMPSGKQYYVFYQNTVKAPAGSPPCSMSTADSASTTIPMCDALVAPANRNVEGDPSVVSSVGDNPTTSQYNFIKTLIDQSTGQMDRYSPANGVAIGAPVTSKTYTTHNPNNLGLGFYALSVPEVYGCTGNQSHAGNPNCSMQYPVSTAYPADTATYGGDLWKLAGDYVGSGVGPVVPTISDPVYAGLWWSASNKNKTFETARLIIAWKTSTVSPPGTYTFAKIYDAGNNEIITKGIQGPLGPLTQHSSTLSRGTSKLGQKIYVTFQIVDKNGNPVGETIRSGVYTIQMPSN